MMNLTIEAPWYTFQKKVKALFGGDPDIKVGEVIEQEDGRSDYAFCIEVRNYEKFLALDRLLPKIREFGNITLGIMLFNKENANTEIDRIALYGTLFEGNPIVKDIKNVSDFTGTRHGFIRFKPEVIQFPDDNIDDYSGNWSGLAQDIAREVFDHEMFGIHFCTADVNEAANAVEASKPDKKDKIGTSK